MTKPTLSDVARYFDNVATIHKSTGHIDAVDKAVDCAVTVREADEIIERCRLFIEASTPDSHKPTQLLADIRRILGERND